MNNQPRRIVDCGKTDNFHVDRTHGVDQFFRDARRFPVLSQEEEHKLLVIAKTGKGEEANAARNRLIECNQLFVASIAKKMNTNGNFLDLIEEGIIGLMLAIDSYDLSTGNRLISYAAHWIRKRMTDYNIKYSKIVRPNNANLIFTYARKARNAFFLEHERYPSLEELKDVINETYNTKVSYASDLEPFVVKMILNERERDNMTNPSGGFMDEYDSKTATNNVDADSDANDNAEVVKRMLSTLDDRQREIIQRMYGIGTDIEETADTIALRMGISVNRVKRMAKDAIAEMRVKSKNMTD